MSIYVVKLYNKLYEFYKTVPECYTTKTLVGYFKDEFKAAKYTAQMNRELQIADRSDIVAVCEKRNILRSYLIDSYDDNRIPVIKEDVFAKVLYDPKHNTIFDTILDATSNITSIKYTYDFKNITEITMADGNTLYMLYIPYKDKMIDNILDKAKEYYDEHRTDKNKTDKRT